MNAWKQIRQKALVLITCVALSCNSFAQTVTYFHNDISGTPLLATDAAGNVLWKENNRPYGDKLNAQPASAGNKIGYHGKPFDDNTGLSYMGARYYDPVLGRFTGIDPVGFVEGNLHSFNRYAYASNNPYKFVDPDGRYIERGIEALSITIGVASFASNIQQGNWLSATVDAMGVVADVAGVAVPGVPGVVGLGIRASREAADAATTAAKGVKPDFVVTSSGTAVPVSQSRMREGFDAAGFSSRAADETAEAGVIHSVPTRNGAIDVRTMEGGGHHGRRAVFTREGTNDPIRMDGRQFPNGTPRADRRAGSHLDQSP